MDYTTLTLLLALCISSTITPTASTSPALLLTPLIKANKTEEARRLSEVNPSLFLNLTSHSGFLTVDPRYNSNTFFWYFPVADKPVNETPWIIWLQGGPGATSLAGLFDEIGPFHYDDNKHVLKPRESSWCREFSVVFVDNPVGTGYSFTDSDLGFARNATMYSNHLYSALQQFLTIFPELRGAPLYLAGESYAGRYVPALGNAILDQGELAEGWEINLQGLILGNPVLNREDIVNLTAVFYQWGLVDTQGVLAAKPLQDTYDEAVKNGDVEKAYEYRDKLMDKLQDLALQQQVYNMLVDNYHFKGFEEYISREEVREAMHVGQIKFTFDNLTVHEKLIPDFLSEVQSKIERLLDHYKVLIYCGHLDLTSPCVPNAEARRRKWHWKRKNEFLLAPRVPWWYNGTVAGYVKSGGGLTEALVRGAGHLVPVDKPGRALQLVSTFIRGLDAELPPNYAPDLVNNPDLNYSSTTKPPDTTAVNINDTKVTQKHELTTKPSSIESVTPKNEATVTPKPFITASILPGVKPDDQTSSSSSAGVSAGTIVSVVINLILVIILAVGAVIYYRQKKKHEEFFYSNVDNNSEDIFLT